MVFKVHKSVRSGKQNRGCFSRAWDGEAIRQMVPKTQLAFFVASLQSLISHKITKNFKSKAQKRKKRMLLNDPKLFRAVWTSAGQALCVAEVGVGW